MDTPLVSVIVPVWNRARFLPDALESICRQNYAPIEILVCDDGSTDETPEVAQRPEYAARYLPLPHRGLGMTRRTGIAEARGEFLAFLDSDDLWSDNKLALQIGLLRDNPETLIVNGYTQLMRLVSTDSEPMQFENWGAPVLAPSYGSALFRREVIEQVGLVQVEFNPEVDMDVDWFLPARERGIPILIHSDVVQYYRRHKDNISNEVLESKQSVLSMLKHSLARRKQLGQEGVSLPPLKRVL